jgi:broad specificity phosphatase PhoE
MNEPPGTEPRWPPSGPQTVLLARHGQTNDNIEPIRVQGFTDTPLNETGRRQAAGLAERVAGCGISSLWTSDLSRAWETAEIVGARVGLTPRLDARLREANRGRWEGRLFIDIERDEPELYAAWRRAGQEFRFPGGESLRDQFERVSQAIEDIRRQGPLPALVVCHGGSIRAMLCARDPRGLDAFHDFEVPNVSVIQL